MRHFVACIAKPGGSMKGPPPVFGAFHAQAVDDAGRGACFARGFLSALDVEHMMDAIQRAIPVSQAEIIVHGPSGRKLLAGIGKGAEDLRPDFVVL